MAEALGTADGILDEVTVGIAFPVVADGAFAVAPTWDYRNGASLACQARQLVGVVALVAEQVAYMPGAFEKGQRDPHVDVAGRQHQRKWRRGRL
jgi:hypothetical protein